VKNTCHSVAADAGTRGLSLQVTDIIFNARESLMKTYHHGLLMLAWSAALAVAPCLPAAAGEITAATQPIGSIERAEAKNATALLDRAVEYLQSKGPERAFAAFNNRQGAFVSGPYYVYAVGLDGMMHANGGAPDVLTGTNTLDLHDAAGKPLIRELLQAAASHDSGTIEYRWLNRADNHVENKTANFRKVGKYVLVVGYYTPRATQEEARALLAKAVEEVKKSGERTAFKEFNDPNGGFIHSDLYVFAIGLDDGKYRAYGTAPQQVGQNVSELRDAAGKPLVREMMAVAKEKGSGTVDYVWRNPATNAVESKHSLIQRVDDVLLGVGYYAK
jgi:cytochrome c